MIGDARNIGNARDAIRDGYHIGKKYRPMHLECRGPQKGREVSEVVEKRGGDKNAVG